MPETERSSCKCGNQEAPGRRNNSRTTAAKALPLVDPSRGSRDGRTPKRLRAFSVADAQGYTEQNAETEAQDAEPVQRYAKRATFSRRIRRLQQKKPKHQRQEACISFASTTFFWTMGSYMSHDNEELRDHDSVLGQCAMSFRRPCWAFWPGRPDPAGFPPAGLPAGCRPLSGQPHHAAGPDLHRCLPLEDGSAPPAPSRDLVLALLVQDGGLP